MYCYSEDFSAQLYVSSFCQLLQENDKLIDVLSLHRRFVLIISLLLLASIIYETNTGTNKFSNIYVTFTIQREV